MKKIRNTTLALAAVSLLLFALNTWTKIDIPEDTMTIVNMVAGVLVALGILTDTGDEPQPITKESIMSKAKSPVAVGAVFALISYVMYHNMNTADADMALKILDTIVVAIFGFSVYNNPNNQEALR
ncbi:MAG: hypothetical protein AB1Z23_03325 [Eubacteriales bacterium]